MLTNREWAMVAGYYMCLNLAQDEPITLDDSDDDEAGGAKSGAEAAVDGVLGEVRRSARGTRYRSTAERFEARPC